MFSCMQRCLQLLIMLLLWPICQYQAESYEELLGSAACLTVAPLLQGCMASISLLLLMCNVSL